MRDWPVQLFAAGQAILLLKQYRSRLWFMAHDGEINRKWALRVASGMKKKPESACAICHHDVNNACRNSRLFGITNHERRERRKDISMLLGNTLIPAYSLRISRRECDTLLFLRYSTPLDNGRGQFITLASGAHISLVIADAGPYKANYILYWGLDDIKWATAANKVDAEFTACELPIAPTTSKNAPETK